VVCKWIGNSAAIAATHYLQLTDEHFARATRENSTSEAAQNPTQKLQESARNGQNGQQGQEDENASNAGDFNKKRLNAGDCERRLMTPTGLQPSRVRAGRCRGYAIVGRPARLMARGLVSPQGSMAL